MQLLPQTSGHALTGHGYCSSFGDLGSESAQSSSEGTQLGNLQESLHVAAQRVSLKGCRELSRCLSEPQQTVQLMPFLAGGGETARIQSKHQVNARLCLGISTVFVWSPEIIDAQLLFVIRLEHTASSCA